MTTDIKEPRVLASEVTPEQVGIYAGSTGEQRDPANPHNITKDSLPTPEPKDPSADRADGDQTGAPPTNEPEVFDPRLMGDPEPGPLDLPPARGRHGGFDNFDAGEHARGKVKDRSLKARAKRMWNWIKFLTFMAILVIGAVVYWQYTVRKHTYVVEPRICFFETADKQVRITGTRYYSYMQNEMFGLRWHLAEDTSIKTEIDLKGNSMVIASLGGKDGPTSKFISMGELGKEPLPPAETYVITMDKRSVVLSDETFCR